MKRVLTIAAGLLTLLAVAGAGLATGTIRASSSADAGAAAPAFTWAAPKNDSNEGNVKPGQVGASIDGTANNIYPGPNNDVIELASNTTLYGDFGVQSLDSSPNKVGSDRIRHDSRGRLHATWYHNNGDGSTDIYYGRKDPGTAGSHWVVYAIPTAANYDGYKVLDIAVGQNDRVYVLYARNTVGARIVFTDDGVNWSLPEELPGPITGTASDFAIGASTTGNMFVGWFDRDSGHVLVQMKNAAGAWGPVTDVSARPSQGQDYGPRFATDAFGGVRMVWTGFDSPNNTTKQVFYRAWSPACGWTCHPIVQLSNTPGSKDTRGVDIASDPTGTDHIIFDDDTGRDSKNVTTYYVRGSGVTFSRPELVFPFGSAPARNPDLDVNQVNGTRYVVHVTTNSSFAGLFDNYYTYTDTPVTGLTPVPTATSTAAPSPTPCTNGTFSDVPPGSAFYLFVNDLVVRGAISGYSDCTFRVFNNITRAQIAKVIILADGYTLVAPPNPDFADVPYGSTFYNYIEAAFLNGIISGYNCGGPGEPCDPQNHPYFRPFAYVTRGQLSKMDTLARNWALLNPTQPDFTDVPTSSPFYTVIETAYLHGIISGYNCGGPGEPCDPQNHPYFRSANTATRGQAAKIIDLSIYSGNITPTPVPPTSTPVPPTSTPVPPTNTPVPPTSTVTSTAVPGTVTPTATSTSIVPTLTVVLSTPTPTGTATPTVTGTPPTATTTSTATATTTP